MTSKHERKKQPEFVRRKLLDCGGELAARSGLGSVTIQAVSDAAGVTKGGMLHHFPDKRQFLVALFEDTLARQDRVIDALVAQDPDRPGIFSHAYAELCLQEACQDSQQAAQSFAMMGDAELRQRWNVWFQNRLQQHARTDSEPLHQIVRLAADGVWMAGLSQTPSPEERRQLRAQFDQLLRRTPTP